MILRALSVPWTSFAPQMGNHLWQSTLFVVLAAILVFALRKNQGRVRYWVWLTASVKFLIPFSLLIALGSHLATPQTSTPAQAVVYSAVEDFSQPFAEQEMPSISEVAPSPAPVSRFHLLSPIIVAVWLAGIIVVLLVWATSWIRVSLMVRRAVPLGEGPEVAALRSLEPSLGVHKPTRLVLSPDWMEPGIFGILRPVLIWPEGIAQHLDHRHVEAILAHEICHARRHDNLTAVLHMLVEAVFWFHPLVWWMGARLEEERERACDEEVSLLCRQPQIYAESILRVCKFCSESPLACVSGITGADLKKRIVQIMTQQAGRKLDLSRKLILGVAAVIAVALPVTFGLVHAPQVRAQSAPAQGTGATPIKPMGRDAHPSFEVATIKPHDPASQRQGFHTEGDRFIIRNESVASMMSFAYSIHPRQIVDAPDSLFKERWEIEGTTDTPGEPNLRQMQEMVQKLLTERFQLKFHRDKRELSVFALRVAKGGSKLKPAADPSAVPDQQGNGRGTEQTITYTSADMANFIMGEQFFLDRPLVDQTGLTGRYDFSIHYTYDEVHATDPNAPPGLFTAIQGQLGLKFEPTKAPVDIFVIDHIEEPTVDGAEMQPAAPVLAGQAGAPKQIDTNGTVEAPEMPDWQRAAGGKMEFEVASIRLIKNGVFPPSIFPISNDDSYTAGPNDSFIAGYALVTYIQFAYKLRLSPDQQEALLAAVPQWVSNDDYEIRAKASPSRDQKHQLTALMMQALLVDRFKLAVHFETARFPYSHLSSLTPGKLGPKLLPHSQGPPCDVPSKTFLHINAKAMIFTQRRIIRPWWARGNTTMGLLAASYLHLRSVPNPYSDRSDWTQRKIRFHPGVDARAETPVSSKAASNPTPEGQHSTRP